nr:tetratricopeptide repeat protein [Geoanaerobacter pelophilus]
MRTESDHSVTTWGLVIALLVLLAYSSVFSAGFIWDDDAYVINNLHLRSFDGLFSIWLEPGATPQYYPMVFTLFWAQFQAWGLNPLGYHLVNILLHIANAILLWSCLRRINIQAAFWGAAVFALHPVHLESVAWITELKNVLSLFFYLLSLLAYLRYVDPEQGSQSGLPRRIYYAGSLLLFLLALFSKTVSGSLPAAILLLHWWQTGQVSRRKLLEMLPFFSLALILGLLTAKLEVTHVLARGAEWDFSLVDRFLIAGRAVWFYACKLLWPYPLIFNYPRWVIDSGDWWQYLFPLALLLLLAALWFMRLRIGRGPLAATLFFVGTLFPALGFFNVYPMRFSFVADHFQYIASIGVIVLFCAGADRLQQKLPTYVVTVFLWSVVLACTILTWYQGRIYQNNLTLFSDTIDKNPASWFSYANRGTYYANNGREDLALVDLEKALALNPDEADAMHMRGVISLKQKNTDRAFADFDRSIVLRPWRTDYYKNRSVAYRYTGQLDNALIDADKVIELEPDNAANYQFRASIQMLGEAYPAALEDLNKAIALDPEEADSWANRGLIFFRQGRHNEALADLNKALALRPDLAAALFNRGLVFAAMGNADNASADLTKAKLLGYPVDEKEIKRILASVVKVKGKPSLQ